MRRKRKKRLPKSYLASLPDAERRAVMIATLEKTGGKEGPACALLDETWWVWRHYAGQYLLGQEVKRIRKELREKFRIPGCGAA